MGEIIIPGARHQRAARSPFVASAPAAGEGGNPAGRRRRPAASGHSGSGPSPEPGAEPAERSPQPEARAEAPPVVEEPSEAPASPLPPAIRDDRHRRQARKRAVARVCIGLALALLPVLTVLLVLQPR